MTLTIGGVNILPYVAKGGFKWQRADVESSDAGRTLDGTMNRCRVASKVRLDVTLKPLTTAEASVVLTAIKPETVSVSYTDPELGSDRSSIQMYSNNIPASFCMRRNNVDYWTGITFPLIEV